MILFILLILTFIDGLNTMRAPYRASALRAISERYKQINNGSKTMNELSHLNGYYHPIELQRIYKQYKQLFDTTNVTELDIYNFGEQVNNAHVLPNLDGGDATDVIGLIYGLIAGFNGLLAHFRHYPIDVRYGKMLYGQYHPKGNVDETYSFLAFYFGPYSSQMPDHDFFQLYDVYQFDSNGNFIGWSRNEGATDSKPQLLPQFGLQGIAESITTAQQTGKFCLYCIDHL